VTVGAIVHDGGRSNGATWADYNMDGFLDLYVPNGQNPDQSNFLYRNNGLSGNGWINVHCVGTVSNVSAIGTRLTAKAAVAGPTVWQLREVSGHQGFNAQESFNVEVGLGTAAIVDSLVFEWPSGTVDVYTQVALNRFYRATEGEGLEMLTTAVQPEGPAAGPGAAPATVVRMRSFPNPFNPRTTLAFRLAEAGALRLVVYDIGGRQIRVLHDGWHAAGEHAVVWDGRDSTGRSLASGVYFARLSADGGEAKHTLSLVK
jgi:hypothetical protein